MKRVLFFTGAGISADSGISTFRDDEDGLWTRYNPDVVCNMDTFEQNRDLVFKFYNERRVLLEDTQPNKAHTEISNIQKRYGSDNVVIFTQNIDDLFERAGCTNVHHVHGDLKKMRCLSDPSHVIDVGYETTNPTDTCPTCGGSMKPGVTFFGEMSPLYELMHKAFYYTSPDDLIVVIGTSGNVVPLSVIIGTHHRQLYGGKRVLCNKDDNDWIAYEDFDQLLFGRAVDQIDEIVTIVDDWMLG